jgi:hypothetical protein
MYSLTQNWIKAFIESHRGKQFILSFKFHAEYNDGNLFFYEEKQIEALVDASNRYIAIWTREMPKENKNNIWEDSPWTFYSYHDSCWRTDGLKWVFGYWFELRQKMTGVGIGIEDANNSIIIEPMSFFFREVNVEWKYKDGSPDSNSILISYSK